MVRTPIKNFKHTKILATLGPASNTYEKVEKFIKAGADGFRLNFSHGTHEEREQQIKWVREASKKLERRVAIVQDLQGPKIRLGKFDEQLQVQPGDKLNITYGKLSENNRFELPVQHDIAQKVKPGQRLLIADGIIQTTITKASHHTVEVDVKSGGVLSSNKGINLPDTSLAGDILTKKDIADIKFGANKDIDYVALSFVQTADDINRLRKRLKKVDSDAQIIAKIETKAATENLEAIIQASDGVMVARGDLAIETEPEAVPILQRKIVGLAQEYGKISIVATQMLASMVEGPEPTRAEVSDVATAVIIGTDCVMLSDETARGSFPEETIAYMHRIILYTQDNAPLKPLYFREEDTSIQSSLSSAVMTLAHQVNAVAIVAETTSGKTASSIAAHRPSMPVIMVTHRARVAQQLSLVYGGRSYVRRASKKAGQKMTDWLKKQDLLKPDDIVIIISGKYPGKTGGTDTIKIREIR